MAIGIQTPSGFIRLNDKPLDLSLTFDSIIDAKKYVAGIDLEHGTPYDGQIIFVKADSTFDSWIYIQFRITCTSSAYRTFRLDPVSIYQKNKNQDIIQIDASDFYSVNNKLLMFRQIVTSVSGTVTDDCSPNNSDELFVCNRENLYSILALFPLYCNNSGIVVLTVNTMYTTADGYIRKETTTLNNTEGFFTGDITIVNPHPTKTAQLDISGSVLRDTVNNKALTYKTSTGLSAIPYFKNGGTGAYTIEIYADISDYITRKDVK